MSENAVAQVILDEVKRLAARCERVEGRMTTLDNRMSNIETVVADLDSRIKAWPDMHDLGAAARAQLAQTRDKTDLVYQAMATDPEVKRLREDVARFRDQSLDTEVRLGTIEGHIGIKTSVEPH